MVRKLLMMKEIKNRRTQELTTMSSTWYIEETVLLTEEKFIIPNAVEVNDNE